jgi:hypothetical protein
MIAIVKVQRPIASNSDNPPYLIYASGHRHMQEVGEATIPSAVVAAMRNDAKAYFEAEWIDPVGWALGKRVSEQKWWLPWMPTAPRPLWVVFRCAGGAPKLHAWPSLSRRYSQGGRVMKVWITKYVTTHGILEMEVTRSDYHASLVKGQVFNECYHGEGIEWHATFEGALAKAEKMRAAKIASLKKSIAKLEAMKFEKEKDR